MVTKYGDEAFGCFGVQIVRVQGHRPGKQVGHGLHSV